MNLVKYFSHQKTEFFKSERNSLGLPLSLRNPISVVKKNFPVIRSRKTNMCSKLKFETC